MEKEFNAICIYNTCIMFWGDSRKFRGRGCLFDVTLYVAQCNPSIG